MNDAFRTVRADDLAQKDLAGVANPAHEASLLANIEDQSNHNEGATSNSVASDAELDRAEGDAAEQGTQLNVEAHEKGQQLEEDSQQSLLTDIRGRLARAHKDFLAVDDEEESFESPVAAVDTTSLLLEAVMMHARSQRNGELSSVHRKIFLTDAQDQLSLLEEGCPRSSSSGIATSNQVAAARRCRARLEEIERLVASAITFSQPSIFGPSDEVSARPHGRLAQSKARSMAKADEKSAHEASCKKKLKFLGSQLDSMDKLCNRVPESATKENEECTSTLLIIQDRLRAVQETCKIANGTTASTSGQVQKSSVAALQNEDCVRRLNDVDRRLKLISSFCSQLPRDRNDEIDECKGLVVKVLKRRALVRQDCTNKATTEEGDDDDEVGKSSTLSEAEEEGESQLPAWLVPAIVASPSTPESADILKKAVEKARQVIKRKRSAKDCQERMDALIRQLESMDELCARVRDDVSSESDACTSLFVILQKRIRETRNECSQTDAVRMNSSIPAGSASSAAPESAASSSSPAQPESSHVAAPIPLPPPRKPEATGAASSPAQPSTRDVAANSSGGAASRLAAALGPAAAGATPGSALSRNIAPDAQWFRPNNSDLCWIAYCNVYSDLRKVLCCYGEKDPSGSCMYDALCHGKAGEAERCKNHLLNNGLHERRLSDDKKHLFPIECGGTRHIEASPTSAPKPSPTTSTPAPPKPVSYPTDMSHAPETLVARTSSMNSSSAPAAPTVFTNSTSQALATPSLAPPKPPEASTTAALVSSRVGAQDAAASKTPALAPPKNGPSEEQSKQQKPAASDSSSIKAEGAPVKEEAQAQSSSSSKKADGEEENEQEEEEEGEEEEEPDQTKVPSSEPAATPQTHKPCASSSARSSNTPRVSVQPKQVEAGPSPPPQQPLIAPKTLHPSGQPRTVVAPSPSKQTHSSPKQSIPSVTSPQVPKRLHQRTRRTSHRFRRSRPAPSPLSKHVSMKRQKSVHDKTLYQNIATDVQDGSKYSNKSCPLNAPQKGKCTLHPSVECTYATSFWANGQPRGWIFAYCSWGSWDFAAGESDEAADLAASKLDGKHKHGRKKTMELDIDLQEEEDRLASKRKDLEDVAEVINYAMKVIEKHGGDAAHAAADKKEVDAAKVDSEARAVETEETHLGSSLNEVVVPAKAKEEKPNVEISEDEKQILRQKCASKSCAWTLHWSCPGQPGRWKAFEDTTLAYRCCCELGMWRSVTTVPDSAFS
eukprot:TRINITY_DN19103_c0_g1_i1.p1 TRINITY_DN19103_c0_g1~~TRINITY_DN19103_c0_g1_i1.p1  ORF type:complete len:1296 (-),score=238.69 TRINITY_DN19103_c0_g1_i1:114-3812(-)